MKVIQESTAFEIQQLWAVQCPSCAETVGTQTLPTCLTRKIPDIVSPKFDQSLAKVVVLGVHNVSLQGYKGRCFEYLLFQFLDVSEYYISAFETDYLLFGTEMLFFPHNLEYYLITTFPSTHIYTFVLKDKIEIEHSLTLQKEKNPLRSRSFVF